MFCMRSTGLGKRWLRCAKKPSDSMTASCRYCHSSACLPKIRAGISNLTRHFCPFSSCQDSCCNTISKTGIPAGVYLKGWTCKIRAVSLIRLFNLIRLMQLLQPHRSASFLLFRRPALGKLQLQRVLFWWSGDAVRHHWSGKQFPTLQLLQE